MLFTNVCTCVQNIHIMFIPQLKPTKALFMKYQNVSKGTGKLHEHIDKDQGKGRLISFLCHFGEVWEVEIPPCKLAKDTSKRLDHAYQRTLTNMRDEQRAGLS